MGKSDICLCLSFLMFDRSYPFINLGSQKTEGEPYYRVHRFTFRDKRDQRYIVLLEEYEKEFFGIKFHLKSMSNSAKRYELLTGFFDAPAIINTCLKVMAELLETCPNASFGFTGAPLLSDKVDQPTKRFRVYRRIMENLFSPSTFIHYQLPEKNIYLLVNRKNLDPQSLVDWISGILNENYEF